MSSNGWIGIDLDGTLAHYEGWQGEFHIGDPIPVMHARVKQMLIDGHDVRIFTARVAQDETGEIAEAIREWCRTHFGRNLPVTCRKDFQCVAIYDDRAKQVVMNTGKTLEEENTELRASIAWLEAEVDNLRIRRDEEAT